MEISKEDWQLLRKKLPQWQKRYINKLNQEYIALLCSKQPAIEKFWVLEKRLKNDKQKPGVVFVLRKTQVFSQLAAMLNDGAITPNDLQEFSAELKENTITIYEKMIQ